METLGQQPDRRAKWRRLSLLHRTTLIWLLVALVLLFCVIFLGRSFFVSPAYIRVFLWPSVALGLLYGLAWIKLMPTLMAQDNPYAAQTQKLGPIMRYVILPLVMAGVLGFFPLINGVPLLLNYAVSKPYTSTMSVVSKAREGGRSSCNRIHVKDLENHWFGKLCANDEAFAALRPEDSVTLIGSYSWFGVSVSSFRYYAKTDAAPPATAPGQPDYGKPH